VQYRAGLHISYKSTIRCDSIIDIYMYLSWVTIKWE